ncbi:MAG: nitrilase family protein [Cellvibrionaceae bacterium]
MPHLTNESQLRVTPVQTDLYWHQPEANRRHLSEQLAKLKGQTDLVVLPEMFTSGFTTHPEKSGSTGETVDWLLAQSKTLGAAIVGSLACPVDESDGLVGSAQVDTINTTQGRPVFVNRLLFVMPCGKLLHYDKVHLFRMASEHRRYQAGDQRCVIEYRGWRLLLTVCYDLRFPVFCRNQNDYDMMLCVANWPEARRHHWRTLLTARAIENQAYVVGVNRVGVDGNDISYSGDSMVLDFLGDTLLDQQGEWLATTVLDKQKLFEYRERFPVWKDADAFALCLKDADLKR